MRHAMTALSSEIMPATKYTEPKTLKMKACVRGDIMAGGLICLVYCTYKSPPLIMHISLRYTVFFIVGALIGIALGAVGMVLFLRTDAGKVVIQQYVATQPQWPSIAPGQSASTTELIQNFLSGAMTVPVPKAYATVAYAEALNAALRDVAVVAASSTELSNVLIQINNKSLARDFSGFFDLIVKAKLMVAAQQSAVQSFGQDLSKLAAANQLSTDAVTKARTQDLLTKGTAFQKALQTYLDSLNLLLSGSVPTASQISDIKTQSASLETLGVDFSLAAKTLEEHFGPQK